MRRRDNLYVLVAGFSLCIGLVTLADGHAQLTAIAELLLAIVSAVVSLRV
jgi:hypothetical protein